MQDKKSNGKLLKPNSLKDLVKKYEKTSVVQELSSSYQNSNELIFTVPISQIRVSDLINEEFLYIDEFGEFFTNIKENGLLLPILVRRDENNNYEVVDGALRFLMCKKIGIKEIKVVVKEISDELLVFFTLSNQLKDGNSLLKAYTYHILISEYGLTQKRISEITHLSYSQVTNSLRLLSLSQTVKKMVVSRELSYGHARSLIGLPRDTVIKLIKEIKHDGLSVRTLEERVSKIKNSYDSKNEEELANKFNCIVKENNKKIVFVFEAHDDLNDFIEKIKN